MQVTSPPTQKSARAADKCREALGTFYPEVSRRRCEGKAECVAVCPYNVFEVREIDADDYRALPALLRLKLWMRGKQTTYTPRADACQGCGLCVAACPEEAIRLIRRRSR